MVHLLSMFIFILSNIVNKLLVEKRRSTFMYYLLLRQPVLKCIGSYYNKDKLYKRKQFIKANLKSSSISMVRLLESHTECFIFFVMLEIHINAWRYSRTDIDTMSTATAQTNFDSSSFALSRGMLGAD